MLMLLSMLLCLGGSARAQSQEDELSMIRQIEYQRLAPRSLTQFVSSPDPVVRAQVARSLGRIGSPGGLPPLRLLLTDPEVEVRTEAAFSVGLIPGASGSLVLQLKTEAHPAVRAQMIHSLGRVCETRICVEVIQWSLTEEPIGLAPSPIRDAASSAIGRLAYRGIEGSRAPSIVTRLLNQLSYPNKSTRQASAFALESMRLNQLPDIMAEQLFREASLESDPITQARLVRATAHLQGHPRAQADLYTRAAKDPDTGVRLSAARSAADSQWGGVVSLLNDPDPSVRRIAIRSAGEVRSLDHRHELLPFLTALDSNADAPAHLCAAEALHALATAGALEDSTPWLDPKWPSPVRVAAAANSRDAERLLALALSDLDPEVRRTSAQTLMQHLGNVERSQKLLAAEDLEVIVVGARYLATHPVKGAEGPLLRVLEATENTRLIREISLALTQLYADTPSWALKPDSRARKIAKAKLAFSDSGARKAVRGLLSELGTKQATFEHDLMIAPSAELMDIRSVRVQTTRGEFIIELFPDLAPLAVGTFVDRVKSGVYDGVSFYSVEPGFIAAIGVGVGASPRATTGSLPEEINPQPHLQGTVSMSGSGPDTDASQWFITLSPQPILDGRYTVFGQVIAGAQYLQAIQPGDVLLGFQLEEVATTD